MRISPRSIAAAGLLATLSAASMNTAFAQDALQQEFRCSVALMQAYGQPLALVRVENRDTEILRHFRTKVFLGKGNRFEFSDVEQFYKAGHKPCALLSELSPLLGAGPKRDGFRMRAACAGTAGRGVSPPMPSRIEAAAAAVKQCAATSGGAAACCERGLDDAD